ncbi:MAG: Protein kinase, partial [Myxococcales bacterium]|nr:Protein kinase [Myxococcales bacterium]
MAELHLARTEGAVAGAHKLCVVKQMLPALSGDPEFVQMFVDEARLAVALDHPNLVHVHEVGCVDGQYFYAMEYLHGETVARLGATPPRLSLGEALTIVVGVAAGLEYAHDKCGSDGKALCIVHRDVSPQNVIVTFDGAVKLLDFGIAKAADRLTETRRGVIKGKVRYMSPEQIRGEPLDRRADVYSLGVMLWELTTGQTLWDGPGEFAIQRRIVDEDAPPPSARVADYPPELEQIVLAALARSRDARLPSAEALQLALEEMAREHKLSLSSVGLARAVRERFGERVAALRLAQATGAAAVTEHVLADLASRPRGADVDDASMPSVSEVGVATRPVGQGAIDAPLSPAPLSPAPLSPAPLSPVSPSRRRRLALTALAMLSIVGAALLARPYLAPPVELSPAARAPLPLATATPAPVAVDVPA